jgi:fibronectin type 3 domain-containing protein
MKKLILIIAIMLTANIIFAQATTGLSYTYLGNAYSVSKGDATDTNIVIPIEHNGASGLYPVTTIANNGFDTYSLTSITIPHSVTAIGNYAFNNCTTLTSIELPSSMRTIGTNAFQNCTNLEAIIFPDGITSIGATAFSGCTKLERAIFEGSVASLANNTFTGCTSLIFMVLPQGMSSLGTNVFNNCTNLEVIFLPNTLYTIGLNTFLNCPKLIIYTGFNSSPYGWVDYYKPIETEVVWGFALPLNPPINFTSSVNINEVTLNWEPPDTNLYKYFFKGYKLNRGYTPLITTATAGIYTYTDNSPPDGIHTYFLQAEYVYGVSNLISTSVNIYQYPAATNFNPIVNDRDVALSWTPPQNTTNLTGYYLYRNNTRIATLTTQTSYQDNGLDIGYYEYKLFAVYTDGLSPAVECSVNLYDLTPPTSLQAGVGDCEVRLQWHAAIGENVSKLTGYKIYRNGESIATPYSTNYYDYEVTNGVQYTYYITAVYNFDGLVLESLPSNSVSVVPIGVTVFPTPTALEATHDFATEIDVHLTWNTPDTSELDPMYTLSSYRIFKNDVMLTDVNTTNYTDNDLVWNQSYRYYVCAIYNLTETSLPSNVITVNTVDIVFPAPTSLSATYNFQVSMNVKFDWNAPDLAGFTAYTHTGYKIYRNAHEIAHLTNEGSGIPTTYTDTSLYAGSTFIYLVVAVYDNLFESAPTNEVSVTPELSGKDNVIPELKTSYLIGNYPNPFNPSTTIKLTVGNDAYIVPIALDIYNIKGQKVKTLFNGYLQKGEHSFVWNGTDENNNTVSSGIYFYKLTTNSVVDIKKMIMLK